MSKDSMPSKINDMEEFAINVLAMDSSDIKSFFEDNCTELLKNEILSLSGDGTFQSAIRIVGNWYNMPTLQNYIG
jgi:hypothetical protein